MPPNSTDANGSGDLSVLKDGTAYSTVPSGHHAIAPDFGQGLSLIDLQAHRPAKVAEMERARQQAYQTTGDPNVEPLLAVAAGPGPSPRQEQGGGQGIVAGRGPIALDVPQEVAAARFNGFKTTAKETASSAQAVFGGAGGSGAQQLRIEQDSVGGALERFAPNQGFGAATRTRAITGVSEVPGSFAGQSLPATSGRYPASNSQTASDANCTQLLSTGFEASDWQAGYSVPGDNLGRGVTAHFGAHTPATNEPYRCVQLAWEPAPGGGEVTRCIKFELVDAATGDAYAPVFDNPFHLVAHQPLSTFSIDVDTASYSNVRRMLISGSLPPRDAVRIEEMVNYFDYDYPLPTDGRPFSVNVETSDCPWSPTHRLARIGIKGMEFAANQRPAANLVFLVDVSGSMQSANRLPLVQQSLRLLVGELRRDDQVAMVVYAGASGLVLPATQCGNHGTILEAIDRLQAGGSTNGGAGIQLAYETAEANFIEGGVNRVILATDGDFNVGVTNGGELTTLVAEKAKGGVFLTVLGFGMGNLKDATLESLADKGNGNYAYIDTLAEAKKTLVDQIGGTLVTIAKDVKIQVEFNPAQVSSYRLIGYENRLLAARDFNDDTKDAGEIGAGHTVTAFYEIVPTGETAPDDGVGPLRYQQTVNAETPTRRHADSGEPTAESDELMTVKLRYKEPDGDVSELIEVPVVDSGETFADSSDDFAFALSAASLGMLLRGYPTSENFDYDFVYELAAGSMGDDASGYRAEFVELVNRARAIAAARNGPDGER